MQIQKMRINSMCLWLWQNALQWRHVTDAKNNIACAIQHPSCAEAKSQERTSVLQPSEPAGIVTIFNSIAKHELGNSNSALP